MAALLEILSGGTLALANVALGVLGGLHSSLATLGSTDVPTRVGVAVSTFTGLNWAAGGFRNLDSAIHAVDTHAHVDA